MPEWGQKNGIPAIPAIPAISAHFLLLTVCQEKDREGEGQAVLLM